MLSRLYEVLRRSRLAWLGAAGLASVAALGLAAAGDPPAAPAPDTDYDADGGWWTPGNSPPIPAEAAFSNDAGAVGFLYTGAAIDPRTHPFFAPIGTNGRACVTCHQPANAMSISVATIQRRWAETNGSDPLFAAIDGSNCPNLPQADAASHSLLLKRGLFRIALPWPPKRPDGTRIDPEFTIEVVQDPTGCNTNPQYGLNSATPTISVYRRPRPVANLKYVVGPERGIGGRINLFGPKNTGLPMATDPETGGRVTMQIMSDARAPTLRAQARDAALTHLQMQGALTEAQLTQLTDFEMSVYSAQVSSRGAGRLDEPGGPRALGPRNLERNPNGVLGDNFDDPVFFDFNTWKTAQPGETQEQRAFRLSVVRGYDIYFLRPFWVRDSMHLNTVGLGNPAKRTCATCHNMQMTGMDLVSGWVDLGTSNLPYANQVLTTPQDRERRPDLPLFKITCKADAPPHMFLGRVIYTHDPGRALISGRCMDVGSVVMQQFRGLSARAPYFANGSAANLRELVDFYDRRYNIGLTEQDKVDLINFLSVL